MKLTTANSKSPSYTEKHEIYVGTETGSFKRLDVWQENPHHQTNLQDIKSLTKDSKITSLNYSNDDETEILIGRANKFVKVYDLKSDEYVSSIELPETPIVGLCRYDGKLVAGLGTGKVQILGGDPESKTLIAGDDMSHLRQCPMEQKLIATGGKNRQNNLKIFDLESMKQTFSSKNVPNDSLCLEVPVWDSDVAFLDSTKLASCSRYGYIRFYDTRVQRRPIRGYSNENQMTFTCLAANEQYVYSGTTFGALKAFDMRNLKTFVHTYKGFTGSISDLALDHSGKFLVSSSLDRYVRVHNVDSCALLYQCYVKSKAMKILIRDSSAGVVADEDDCICVEKESNMHQSDDEYDALFSKMPTIKDKEVDLGVKRKSDNQKSAKKRKNI